MKRDGALSLASLLKAFALWLPDSLIWSRYFCESFPLRDPFSSRNGNVFGKKMECECLIVFVDVTCLIKELFEVPKSNLE